MVPRRPSLMQRQRRRARLVAVVVALAMVALIGIPLLALLGGGAG
ncbi:MAG: hypothetical protein JWP95_358 [Actinotalea sp.]|nr:hypothetical protein [Actinotalea sp.]